MQDPMTNSKVCADGMRRRTRGLRVMFAAALAATALCAHAQSVLQVTTPQFPVTAVGQSVTQNMQITVASGGNTVVYNSIQLAPGLTDYTMGTITGCVVDGSTGNTDGTTCIIPITFTPTLPGSAAAPLPLSRTAALQIYDVENGNLGNYSLPIIGSGTMPLAVVVPGNISDLVGSDTAPANGYAGDGGPVSGAIFNGPTNIAVDNAGNIYIADTANCIVRRVDKPSQTISTFAGMDPSPAPNCGASTDGNYPTSVPLNAPTGVAIDAAGNVYIADTGNGAVRMVSAATGLMTTVAGSLNSPGYSGDGYLAIYAQLQSPTGIAVDGYGDLFIADAGNYIVREVSPVTGYINTIAGEPLQPGNPGLEGSGLSPTNFTFGNPLAVTVDSQGNLYVADATTQGLIEVVAAAQIVNVLTTVPGVPTSLAVDASDAPYYTMAGSCVVYKLAAGAAAPIAVAGSGSCTAGGDGGSAVAAGLGNPDAVAVDGTGSLYVLESDGIRFVDSTGAQGTTAAFGPEQIFEASNPFSVMLFNGDIAVPAGGTANPLAVFFTGGLASPFATIAAPAPDCSQASTSVSIALNPAAFCTLSMTFAPVTDGPYNASTSLFELPAGGGSQVTQAIQLSGTGTGSAPTATLTPTSQAISAGVDGGVGMAPFTLTNTGSGAPLLISAIGFSNSAVTGFTQLNNCPASLAQNAQCIINVSYAPLTNSNVAQTLVVSNNTSAGQTTAGLTGAGVLPTATISTPGAFTGVVNEGGPTQTITVTNTGSQGYLQISGIYLTSSNGFLISGNNDTCYTAPVPPGGTCSFQVLFSPTTTGSTTNTVNVQVNTAGGLLSTNVSGTATAPAASLSTSAVTFVNTIPGAHSATQTVILSNTGTAPLNISGIALSGLAPQDFTLDASACPAQLAINAMCNIVVDFVPSTYGGFSATLSITDDSGGQRAYSYVTQTVSVSGPSTPPAQASSFTIANTSFASTAVGDPETFAVTLTLNSASTVLKSIAIVSGFTEWSVGQITNCAVDGATTNASGTVCQIAVTFTPAYPGVRNAPLVVTTIENGIPVPYYFGLTGAATGQIAALTPGIIGPYVASDGSHGAAAPLSGMGGPAASASVAFFNGIAIDSANNMYVSDSEFAVVYKIDPQGIISIYAGTPFAIGGYLQDLSGDGGVATGATLAQPGPLALDVAGNLYIGDTDYFGHESIRRVDAATHIITTVVGGGSGCAAQTDSFGDGCTGPQATLNVGVGGSVTGLLLDASGKLYFTATSAYSTGSNSEEVVNYAIRLWNPATNLVSVFAGAVGQTEGSGADGGVAVGAKLSPTTMALDTSGYILAVDNGVQVRRIAPGSGGSISTIAGAPGSAPQFGYACTASSFGSVSGHSSGNGGLATAAKFCGLTGITVDAADNIYLVDNSASEIRRIDSSTGVIVEVAGQNSEQNLDYGDSNEVVGNNDGSARDASLATPLDLRLDGAANIYLMESWGNVRKINVSESALDYTPYFNPNPPFAREAVGVGSVTGPQQVTVVNAGNSGPVSFAQPFITPTAFGISTPDYSRDTATADCISTSAMLAPGAECPINIDFTPTISGAPILDTDTVNDTAGTQSITLNGYASGQASVTLLPALLNFDGSVGVATLAQTFTLTNNTSASIGIAAVSLVGVNSSAFAQTNNCGASLAAGAFCTVSVTFTAPAMGNFVAQLSATYTQNYGGTLYPSALFGGLTGTGGVAEGRFDLDQVNGNPGFFGDQNIGVASSVHLLRFESTGTIPLVIASITLAGTNPGQFAIVSNTCGTTLQPGTNCNIGVTFEPTADTSFTALLTVADNAPDTPQQAGLSGTGTGIAPAILNLSETVHFSDSPAIIGVTAQTIDFPQPFSPVAAGTGPITLSASASSGLAVTFRIVSGPGSISGNQLTLTGPGAIVIAADQAGNGSYAPAPEVQQTVVVEVPPAIMLFATGMLPQGTTSPPVVITLTFTSSFQLGSLTTSTQGAPGTDFTVVSGGSCTLGNMYGPGDFCTVDVTFTPSGPGLITGVLSALDTNGAAQAAANLASVRYR